jgi:hypothetical protein
MESLLKKPSAWIPIVLSLAILAMLLVTLVTSGLVRHEDEGVGAHIFQIWLVVEAVLIAFFGSRWLPRMPQQALMVLAVQIIAALAACFPVFYFNL